MEPVIKIMTEAEYMIALSRGEINEPSLQSEGTIKCCTPQQIGKVVKKSYPGEAVVLVSLHVNRLGQLLHYELDEDGERYPHVYSAIPMTSVKQVQPYGSRDNGTVTYFAFERM
ncbi:MAG: DUF952 domain-containing protein [Exiguobacterium sp.]|jgi:uncharacterized protein (DUF952 family)|uniref:DUF952 domain-containing protein n=1 Tax=Exiguobacterium sp. (strain ATCC BAA-1283 / AT1b) TaxID=360911 RepID=C4L3D3_EXISA|nr:MULTISPECIES: DUF952 domain-containing protein [Exiguobacterium]MBR2077122.1 DUF952 domain-containing protein [Exiguobacterium sp.]QLQ21754.1 MAG: DUF952 domain-containing protein [Paracoccaceae bacterium]ACQ69431.1 protein of unknown function DUF952 [Exiguobacterium sp. AT1b]MBR2759386.1 DUF952 domain-containing protein [Exiguobacterium sp.]MBR3063899.1 DUF952 domain-containing protein [Exiguobacterium sp.]